MGKRSRQRGTAGAAAAPERKRTLRERADAASRVAERRLEQRPKAIWDPFPLTELAIFAGLVLTVVGIFASGSTGKGLIVAGVVLACIGGLETALREHLGGYRSHAGLLAGALALGSLMLVTSVFNAGPALRAGVAIGVFALLFPVLRSAFIRKSGGSGVL